MGALEYDGTTGTPTPTPTSGSCAPTPYLGATPSLPTRIEIENYDKCSNGANGEGITYHDLDSSNNGGQYRTSEGVDVKGTGDSGGGYQVGWIQPGEWLTYTVNVPQSGTYAITARVSSAGPGGTFHIEVNGQNKTGSITVPDTGSPGIFTNLNAQASLSVGTQVMKIVMDSAPQGYIGDLNYIDFTQASGPTACALYTPSTSLPTGFGSPFDVVSAPSTNLMQVTCDTASARIDLGKSDPLQYIYNTGVSVQNRRKYLDQHSLH
jgi:chitinase